MGYGIWDTAYRLWIRSEPKTKAESEVPTIIFTIKCTYFMQGRFLYDAPNSIGGFTPAPPPLEFFAGAHGSRKCPMAFMRWDNRSRDNHARELFDENFTVFDIL